MISEPDPLRARTVIVSSETTVSVSARSTTRRGGSISTVRYSSGTRRPRKSATTWKRAPARSGSAFRRRASLTPGSHSAVELKSAKYSNTSAAEPGEFTVAA